MYRLLATTLLVIPLASSARGFDGSQMDEAQMQQMMQQMQGMQNCMANIDQAEMDAFQKKSEEMDAEVKALCAAGERDAAMSRAMTFGKEVAGSTVMQAMKKCGEGMKSMMPNLPKVAQPQDDAGEPRHICDN